MSELLPARIEARVRNNRLRWLIHDSHATTSAFCRVAGFSATIVGMLLNLKMSPIGKRGAYRKPCLDLAAHFHVIEEWLFPPELYERFAEVQQFTTERDTPEILPLTDETELLALPDTRNQARHVRAVLERAMASLSSGEKRVLTRLYGWDDNQPMTRRACGEELGIGRERVRMIEARAIRKLRHPRHGLRQLRGYAQ